MGVYCLIASCAVVTNQFQKHYFSLSSKRFTLACVPIKDSDHAVHLRCLVRIFDERSIGSSCFHSNHIVCMI